MKVRVKFHQQPGDIPLSDKIHMLESRKGFWLFPWQWIGPKAITSFRRELRARERAAGKREAQREIDLALID